MAKRNITWAEFERYNDNQTEAFESMCRRLFKAEFLKGKKNPHTDHNTPGVEVIPILEPERDDGQPQKRISFQSKYVEQPSSAYSKFKESANKTVQYHKGNLDLVYLFCNKTLTTTSKGYNEIVKIHQKAGIDTEPISNEDLLDLIAEYPDIAEYFFQPRIVADTSVVHPTFPHGISVDSVTGNIVISPDAFQQKPLNNELLRKLVSEKLIICKNYALSLELEALKGELDRLFSYGIDSVDNAGALYYYQLLVLIHDGKEFSEALTKCSNEFMTEAEWLIAFYAAPFELSAEEYKKHTPITQIFAIDKLFRSEYWNNIIELYKDVRDDSDSTILTQLDLHFGLSLLNLQESSKASEVLHSIFARTKEPRMQLYAVFADLRVENSIYRSGKAGHHEVLERLLEQLESFKHSKPYKLQELLAASIKLESSYHLGIADKAYLENAIEEYESYSEQTRHNTIIQYYYALCLELNGERDTAVKVYDKLDWKTDLTIATRYMTCLILNNQAEKAVAVYEQLEKNNVQAEAVYLFALNRSNADSYIDELKKSVESHRNSLVNLLQIAYYTDSEKPSREVVVPALKELITIESLNSLILYQKIEIIIFLAHLREISSMETVLGTIEDVSTMNSFAIGEIYKSLFDVANKEYVREGRLSEEPEDFKAADRIADTFLAADVSRKQFLQIKVLCAGARQMPFSFLKYSKDLFEITHDEETARSVVALLFDRKETDPAKYEPYLDVLQKSEKPDHCIVVASAMLVLGRYDTAEYYAYKALYFLNGKDDYNIFKSYFGYYNYNRHRFHKAIEAHTVTGNVVVMLEENNSEGNPDHLEVCLDSEADFVDETNRSMDVEHLSASNPDYIKLRGSGLQQVLKLRGKYYKIVQIMPRQQYGLSYIFRKIQEKPEMFEGVVWMISTENIDEMIKQMKELTDNSENIKSLLSSYHFEQNEIGLPIDAVAFGDYSRYINVFKYLLYQRDEVLYAGQPIYENEKGQKYVPGLATLMLLSILGRIDVFEAFKHDIIIPESYISFFREEYSIAAESSQVSSSTMYFIKEQPVIMESDKTIPQIWETILKFCTECEIREISDRERIDFKIVDGLTGERLITELGVSPIHLDALLLSQREKATLLCDDLFWRRVATWIGVRNLNL